MANKILDTTLTLNAADPINGVLTLNTITSKSVTYNDDGVVTQSISAITAASGTQLINKSVAKVTYVYIKNTDVANYVTLENDDTEDWGQLGAGEWAFFPVAPSVGLQAKANTAPVILDVALFQAP
tara:strand:+ start:132 stop:509 length:378 start_codon:yes stop_codon:yes gene_type:complete